MPDLGKVYRLILTNLVETRLSLALQMRMSIHAGYYDVNRNIEAPFIVRLKSQGSFENWLYKAVPLYK